MPSRDNTHFVIARRERSDDAAIHRVSRGCVRACLFAYWFTVDRHGLSALAMTRWGRRMRSDDNTHFVIARRERKRTTRQSIVSRGTRTGLSLRLLVHSGSPRAFSPRDDKVWVKDALAMTGVSKTIQNHQSALRSSQFGLSFSIS